MNLALIGVGLIGGSVARAARQAGLVQRVRPADIVSGAAMYRSTMAAETRNVSGPAESTSW